jgi:poly-beta-1,6 N-acetyl-D-glucosamine synthase
MTYALEVLGYVLLGVLILKLVAVVILSLLHYKRVDLGSTPLLMARPAVSVIVPCYNEAAVLENCVASILSTFYADVEVIVVEDGSTDNTFDIAVRLADSDPRVRAIHKANAGKASALNTGIAHAHGEIIITMDADTAFRPNTISYLVGPFADPSVGAVGGNVKVANKTGLLPRQQALEYTMGLNLQRRAFAALGCMQVISGAIGAFRRSALIDIGGFSEDTIVEDMDVTVALVAAGYRVEFDSRAIAYTEAPSSISDWSLQRYRWTFGGFQVLSKHRSMLFDRRSGSMGVIGLPFFLGFPWIDVLASVLLIIATVRAFVGGNIASLAIFYVILATLHVLLALFAIWLDGHEPRSLAVLAAFDSLWYHLLISSVTVWAGVAFIRRRTPQWTKLHRHGANTFEHEPSFLIDLTTEEARVRQRADEPQLREAN